MAVKGTKAPLLPKVMRGSQGQQQLIIACVDVAFVFVALHSHLSQ